MIRSIALTLSILALPCTSLALGLGKLDLQSKLNEPFKAQIELLSASADELDSLKVNLAGPEDFERAGVERSFNLTKLKFDIKETRGADYIVITSNDLIREPYLNFLVEINWNRGRLLREYTALLDPPTYAPVVATTPAPVTSRTQPQPVTSSTETVEPTYPKKIPVVRASAIDTSGPTVYVDHSTGSTTTSDYQPKPVTNTTSPSSTPTPSPSYSGGDYTTSKGDTLWALASSMRPETSVSIQQTMMALYRNNPDAFEQNNINNLKSGEVLSVPDLDEIRQVSKAEAIQKTLEHNQAWQGYRETLANNVSERPDSSGMSLPTTSDDSPGLPTETLAEESDPELRLVGSDDSTSGVGQGSGDTGSSSAVNSDDMAIAQESLVALESENKELQEKLLEAESIIDDLNRLIVLKEDELSALRQQISATTSEEMIEEAPLEEEFPQEEPLTEDMEDSLPMEAELSETIGEEMIPEESSAFDESSQFIQEEPLAETDLSEYGELYDEEPAMEEAFPGESESFDEEIEEPIADVMDDGFEEETLPDEIEEIPAETPVVETQPETSVADTTTDDSSAGVMGMVQQYLGSIMGFVQDNLTLVGSGLGGILALLLGYFGLKKLRSGKEEELELDDDDDILSFGSDDNDDEDLISTVSEEPAPEADSNDTLVMDAPIDLSQPIETTESDAEKTAAHDFSDSGPAGYAEPHSADADEDPLAEVNVFLAYEHFDQAEEFVKKNLEEQPDNLEFHTKLLEVYYASGDKKAYEDAAKVLQDKFGSSGEHWDNALAMWAELSPNREIFTERTDGLDDTQAIDPDDVDDALTSGSGIVDLTAQDPSAVPDSGLEETAADVLDITGQNVLPTKQANEENKGADPQGLIDTLSEASDLETLSDSNILDVSTSSAVGDELEFSLPSESAEHILDLTGGDGGEDILDITAGSQEDLLDVTASTDLDTLASLATNKSDIEEENTLDFDVQALDLDVPDEAESTPEPAGDSSIERAMDALDAAASTPSEAEESSIDFDLPLDIDNGTTDSGSIDLDISGAHELPEKSDDAIDPSEAVTVEMDAIPTPTSDEETVNLDAADISLTDDFSVDLTLDSDNNDDEVEVEPTVKMGISDEVTLDFDTHGQDTDDLKSDLGDTTVDEGSVDLDLTNEFTLDEENTDSLSDGFELELDDEEEMIPNTELDIDMEGTVELPENATAELSENTTNYDAPTVEMPKVDYMADDDDKTVFIPRSASSEQQSLEDEVSTKLDLAKAYVELGDNDSAKTILDEIVAEGNDEQKQVAKQLLDQI